MSLKQLTKITRQMYDDLPPAEINLLHGCTLTLLIHFRLSYEWHIRTVEDLMWVVVLS